MTGRVLQVITDTDRRGAQVFALDLATALRERDWEVRTVALVRGTRHPGLDVEVLGSRSLGWRTLRALRREAQSASVVIAQGSTSLPATVLSLVGTRVPVLYRSIGEVEFWASTRVRRLRLRVLLRRPSAVVVLWGDAITSLQRLGVPSARVAVIGGGVDPARFAPIDPAERHGARARLGLPSDAGVIAAIGSLSFEKRVDVAIRSLAELPQAHLLVAGEGPERDRLERLASDLAPGRVHFLGAVLDVLEVLAAADVLVLPSATEALPSVAVEAGMRGLPVVATPVGALPEVVVDGVTGFLVPVGDHVALARAVTRAIEAREVMGTAARQHCIERYDMATVAERWSTVLSGALS